MSDKRRAELVEALEAHALAIDALNDAIEAVGWAPQEKRFVQSIRESREFALSARSHLLAEMHRALS